MLALPVDLWAEGSLRRKEPGVGSRRVGQRYSRRRTPVGRQRGFAIFYILVVVVVL